MLLMDIVLRGGGIRFAGLYNDSSCASKSVYIAVARPSTFASYPSRHGPVLGRR